MSGKKLQKKIGRNDPCPCGSGKKYKKCCLKRKINKKFSISNSNSLNISLELKEFDSSNDISKDKYNSFDGIAVGDFLDRIYEVHSILVGGMGVIYVCLDHKQMSMIALKKLKDRFLYYPEIRNTFKNEAKVWIGFDRHPCILQAYSFQEFNNREFILLEYISPDNLGRNTLEHYLSYPISLEMALKWGIQFCYGMEHAVSLGLKTHGDIKPNNILITLNGSLKITDFGLARLKDEGKKKLKIIIPTPWRSPEYNTEDEDIRSDIYSFGLMFYQMINPNRKKSLKVFDPIYINDFLKKINPNLRHIVRKCLQKKPINRYHTFQDLRIDLEKIFIKKINKLPYKPPDDIELMSWEYLNKGQSLRRLGLYDDAVEAYERAIQKNPDFFQAYSNLGNVYLAKGMIDKALLQFKKALQINPDFDLAHGGLGLALRRKGRLDDAISEYKEAVKINPNYVEAHYNWAITLGYKGLFNEAIIKFEDAINIEPKNGEIHYNYGIVLAKLGRINDAIHENNLAIRLKPENIDAYNNLGILYCKKGLYNRAIEEYKKLLSIKPGSGEGHMQLGIIFAKKGLMDSAIKEFREALKINPESANFRYNLGLALLRNNQVDDAILEFSYALKIDPNYVEAHNDMGNAFSFKGLIDKAIEKYNIALSIDPDYFLAHYNLGLSYLLKGQMNVAIQKFKDCLKINPDYLQAKKALNLIS